MPTKSNIAQEAILEEMDQKGVCTVTRAFCSQIGLRMGFVIDVIGRLLERGIIRRCKGSGEADLFSYERREISIAQDDAPATPSGSPRAIDSKQKLLEQARLQIIEYVRTRADETLFFGDISSLARSIDMPIRIVRTAAFSLVHIGLLEFRLQQTLPRKLPERLVLCKQRSHRA